MPTLCLINCHVTNVIDNALSQNIFIKTNLVTLSTPVLSIPKLVYIKAFDSDQFVYTKHDPLITKHILQQQNRFNLPNKLLF